MVNNSNAINTEKNLNADISEKELLLLTSVCPNNNTELQNNFNLFLNAIDTFHKSDFTYISGKNNFKTKLGGLFSIFHFITILFCIIFFGFQLFASIPVSIDQSIIMQYEILESFEESDIRFLIAFDRKHINSLYFTSHFDRKFPFNDCSDEDYKKFYDEERNSTTVYFCSTSKILGHEAFNASPLENFFLLGCDTVLKSPVPKNCTLVANSSIPILLKYEHDYVKSSDNKVEKIVDEIKFDLGTARMVTFELTSNIIRIDDYVNKFGLSPAVIYYRSVVSTYVSSACVNSKCSTGFILKLQYSKNFYITYYRITYLNFPDLLAKCVNFISIFGSVILVVNKFVIEYIFINLIVQILLKSDKANDLFKKIDTENSLTNLQISKTKTEIMVAKNNMMLDKTEKKINNIKYNVNWKNYLKEKISILKNKLFHEIYVAVNSYFSYENLIKLNIENECI